ncbi:MAG: hypothetical protein L0Y74_06870 [candidate division Zixibacteria bacterium]|nr:hypothetical protein [candidate division Zixibacteria bacterium]
MALTPSGRLSAVETDKGLLQIQTEFKLSPSKTIVTAHIFSGQVLRRQETPWPGVMETEEDKYKAEQALGNQHRKEVDFAVANWEKMVNPVFKELQQADTDKRMDAIKEKLASLASVKKILLLDKELNYLVIKNEGPPEDFKELEFVRKIIAFSELIGSATRVGKMQQYHLQSKNSQHVLQSWGDRFVLLETALDADLNQIKTNLQLALLGG